MGNVIPFRGRRETTPVDDTADRLVASLLLQRRKSLTDPADIAAIERVIAMYVRHPSTYKLADSATPEVESAPSAAPATSPSAVTPTPSHGVDEQPVAAPVVCSGAATDTT